MSTRFPTRHCERADLHEAHMVTTPEAASGTCPGYPAPAPHQVWQDADKRLEREGGVRFRVITRIDGTHAHCHDCNKTGEPASSRIFKIRLDRFKPTSTGYRYVGVARRVKGMDAGAAPGL
ncbi:hypothetical protein [Streptomyces sp. DH12]|uniref:hypothetical protein n=1 Tax=Streptomyces sp. DH12 TaxID=2857010 RepID=UPI001E2ADD07|nr:hypothetical protein [Streptomyces sp. DH12]